MGEGLVSDGHALNEIVSLVPSPMGVPCIDIALPCNLLRSASQRAESDNKNRESFLRKIYALFRSERGREGGSKCTVHRGWGWDRNRDNNKCYLARKQMGTQRVSARASLV